jgi:YD repeat-containing protein
MRYDSLGRLVLNLEPNTSVGFTPDLHADPATLDAWRYAYNDAGDLAGTSDARGCGVNYHYDAAGRMVAEDYSPCESSHATYSPVSSPGASAGGGTGAEVADRYDTADPETAAITDAAGRTFPADATQYPGRVVSVADRGSKGVLRYDARGRVTGSAIKIARPGGATPDDPSTFAPRWYLQDRTFDAADRPVDGTTGATTPELLGAGGASRTTTTYTRRGVMSGIGSSYGALVASTRYAADGLVTSTVYGDLAATERAYAYDDQRRLRSAQTFRAGPGLWTSPSYSPGGDASQQLLLEDLDFTYDQVGNITEIADWRIADERPDGSKPASRKFEYDDQYRLTRTRYDYATGAGTDPWTSPFAAENAGTSDGAKPSPQSGHRRGARVVQLG